MFLIYGTRNGKKIMKFLVKKYCETCGKECNMNVIKTYTSATIFFIPIFSVNKKYFLICPHCGKVIQISKQEFKEIKEKAKESQIVSLSSSTQTVEVKASVENVANSENEVDTQLKQQIRKEIELIVNKLKEKNISITKSNLQPVKDALKQRLMGKFNNEHLINQTISEFFDDFKL